MTDRPSVLSTFVTFGSLLKHLRRRARMSQRDLSIAVGYSEAQISRLESNDRSPDIAAVTALFIPALGLEKEPEVINRLLALAKKNQTKHGIEGSPPEKTVGDWDHQSWPRTNILLELSSFIGREQEIRQINQILSHVDNGQQRTTRLLTLTGSGGVGKTRLALRVGTGLMESFEHGVWLVTLATISDPLLVPSAVASALGIQGDTSKPEMEKLVNFLQPRNTLVILDNCEHVIDSAARLSVELLSRCSGLCILATSHEPLGVPGETTFRVPSLALPNEKAPFESVESVLLFLDRARAAVPDFRISPSNGAVIAQICRRLDGIPLAIELAAARVSTLGVEQIAGRLDDAFHLLTGGSRTLLPRQQTLRASIDWGYRLLSDIEKILLARLSVFSGGWTVEMAEAVCEDAAVGLERGEIIHQLMMLVKKSLVSADFSRETTRYWMLDTIRQYAAERLEEAGETTALRSRHLDVVLGWVETLEPHLRGPNQVELLDRLQADLPNLRSALEWSLTEVDLEVAEKGLRLAGALRWLWHIRSNHMEGTEWLKKVLAANPADSRMDPRWIGARARALSDLAFLNLFLKRVSENLPLLEESDALFRSIGELSKRGLIRNLYVYESTLWAMGEKQRGKQLITEALELASEVGDRFNLAEALDTGVTYVSTLQEALNMHNQALEIRRELGDIDGLFSTLFYRAQVFWFLGDAQRALRDAAEALIYAHKSKNHYGYNRVLFRTGWIRCRSGDIEQGLNDMEQVLARTRAVSNDVDLWARLVAIGAARMWLRSDTGLPLEAELYLNEALVIATRMAKKEKIAEALFYLAETSWLDGNNALAEERFRASAEAYRDFSTPWTERILQYSLGKAALIKGDPETARGHFQQSLRIVMKLYYPWEMHYLYAALAQTFSACSGEAETAVILQGAADAHPPVDNREDFGERMLYARFDSGTFLADCRVALGEARFSAAYARGRSLTLEQAAAIALRS